MKARSPPSAIGSGEPSAAAFEDDHLQLVGEDRSEDQESEEYRDDEEWHRPLPGEPARMPEPDEGDESEETVDEAYGLRYRLNDHCHSSLVLLVGRGTFTTSTRKV